MSITNTTKPSAPSFTNTARVSFGETWTTITTTWVSETRTWLATVSLMSNGAKQTSSMTNTSK